MSLHNIKLPDENKNTRPNLLQWASFALLSIILVLLITFHFYQPVNSKSSRSLKKQQALAENFVEKGLFLSAIETYEELIDRELLAKADLAAAYFEVGQLYFKLHQYEKALKAYYLSEDSWNLKGLQAQIRQNKITCFRRLDKYGALQQELKDMTDVNPSEDKPEDLYAAKIESQFFSKEDMKNMLNAHINSVFYQQNGALSLSVEDIKKEKEKLFDQYSKPQQMQQFMQQWLLSELFYRQAVQADYLNEKEILAALDLAEKQMLAQEYLRRNILSKIKIDSVDVKKFYEKNPDMFSAPDSIQALVWKFAGKKDAQDFLNGFDAVNLEQYRQQKNCIPYISISEKTPFAYSDDAVPLEEFFKLPENKLDPTIYLKGDECYLVFVNKKQIASTVSLEDASEQITQMLSQQELQVSIQSEMEKLKQKYQVELYNNDLKKSLSNQSASGVNNP